MGRVLLAGATVWAGPACVPLRAWMLVEDGRVAAGLPDIQRTLNWVHLSARFPVRVYVQDPDPTLFRIGATAVTVVK